MQALSCLMVSYHSRYVETSGCVTRKSECRDCEFVRWMDVSGSIIDVEPSGYTKKELFVK
jgi:hypothetical protein